jgi:hypothetical protein
VNRLGITHGAYDPEGRFFGDDAIADWDTGMAMFMVNHHVRQSFSGYQRDYTWETGENAAGR